MKQNNLLFVCAIALLLISGAIVLYGCGAAPGSGGGSSSVNRNMGTISGSVSELNETSGLFEPFAGALIAVSTEAMSVEVTSTSDAQGIYTLRGLPTGEVQLNVSGGGYTPCSAVADLDKIDFVIGKKKPALTELTSIKGTIEAIPLARHVHDRHIRANAYNNLYRYMPVTYESSTNTYEVRNVPVGDTIYVMAMAGTDGTSNSYTMDCYAYNKIVAGSGTNYLNISFEPMVSIEATCSLLPGFTVEGYAAYISTGNKFMLQAENLWGAMSNTFTIGRLPALQGDDKYIIGIGVKNIYGDRLQKYFYNIGQGNSSFDISSPSVPSGSFLAYPASGETISGTATFEWQSVSWADFYELWVYDSATYSKWIVWTRNNKITMPNNIWNSLPSGDYSYQVYAYKFKNFPDKYDASHAIFNIVWTYDYVYFNTNLRPFKK